MEDQAEKQHVKQYDWLKPHQFKAGQSGNPNGRPKGPTLKTWVKNHFESMTDEERAAFLNKIDPIKAWEMGEGKADTKSVVTATVEVNNLKELPDEELDRLINASFSGESKERESEA